jgi:hypothetical protein
MWKRRHSGGSVGDRVEINASQQEREFVDNPRGVDMRTRAFRRAALERLTDELRTLLPVFAPTGQPKEARGNAQGNLHVKMRKP